MTCPRCKCPECRRVESQAVLKRFVSRETAETSDLRRAFELLPRPGRFVERRELGTPPSDPDAEQLAGQVSDLAGELRRGG